MAITFGVMSHVDRAPAAPVVPLQCPVIEATVVPQVFTPVLPIESARHGQMNMDREKASLQQLLQAYNPRGERRPMGGQSGFRLDLFA
jgi:hypothetical protein